MIFNAPKPEVKKEPVEYTQEECIRETQEHIALVKKFMLQIADDLIQRASVHDASKLESPELEVFTKVTPRLKTMTYGSDEYKASLKEMSTALDHHYANNSHHPEHYVRCYMCTECSAEYAEPRDTCSCGHNEVKLQPDMSQMNLSDIVEMICDWKAATLRHDDGDIITSIEKNKERFGYPDMMASIFMNSIKAFK